MTRRIFDSHFHIIDSRFPLVRNNGYLPPEFRATEYLRAVSDLGVTGGAMVSGSFQAFDQTYPVIAALPKVSIDHLGMTSVHRDVLLRLVSRGVRVKATGFGRVQLDVTSTIREIHQENPEALMFGTDFPSTRAPVPFHRDDLELVSDILADDASLALYGNGARFYDLTG